MIPCLVPDLPPAAELLPWLQRIDENRWYTNGGPLVREFEQRLSAFIAGGDGVSCVTLASGMSALELGLLALGIGAGKRVLLPALTFPATALAVARCGAEPVLCDVSAETWAMTPSIARQALARSRVDAVVPVASFGCPLPAEEWADFASDTGVPVLADAAAALGAQKISGQVQWAFSLHATKPMGVGEGGLFVSADGALAEKVRRLANFSFEHFVACSSHGTNAKMSEYAAAVGLAQLERWPRLLQRRREVFDEYRRRLAALPQVTMQPLVAPPATLCVRLPADAAAVAAALAQSEIETRRWYLPPLHRHPAFGRVRCLGPAGSERLPVTEQLATSLLGLPFHSRLGSEDVATVVAALATAIGNPGTG
ncbi:MAG: DegT/DnrJ/EryC1/StrS family aminotransferase [Burkholderiales bacterium]|nr:MAG: DegT/DnrJ/EryC1/StrS family aminotransferase [Burkholderiales bacterium]